MNLWNWWRDRTRRESELQDEIETHLRLAERDRVERGRRQSTRALRYIASLAMYNSSRMSHATNGVGRGLTSLAETPVSRCALCGACRLQRGCCLSLALSIGANSALFSLVDALLLRSLPVKEPEQLVRVQRVATNDGGFSKPTA